MVKYILAMSVDSARFNLEYSEAKMYDYKHQAEENKESWERVIKVTIEEV